MEYRELIYCPPDSHTLPNPTRPLVPGIHDVRLYEDLPRDLELAFVGMRKHQWGGTGPFPWARPACMKIRTMSSIATKDHTDLFSILYNIYEANTGLHVGGGVADVEGSKLVFRYGAADADQYFEPHVERPCYAHTQWLNNPDGPDEEIRSVPQLYVAEIHIDGPPGVGFPVITDGNGNYCGQTNLGSSCDWVDHPVASCDQW